RSSFHDFGDCAFRSGPARMKPLLSRHNSGGSQLVLGSAPMKIKTEVTGRCSSPFGVFRSRLSSRPVPHTELISVSVSTMMLGVASIWSIRYLDMLLARE